MMITVKAFGSLALPVSELEPNGGVHEILTSDGRTVRFFLKRGEAMSLEHMKLYVENADINIQQVPADQRDAMRERLAEMRKALGLQG
jgi:hypothetical protein